MGNYNRDTLLNDLRKNVMAIAFTKVNGDKRELRCTLMPELLPPNAIPTHLDEMHQKEENLKVIACWDVENGGWRSFRIESVEYVQSLDPYHYM